MRYLKLFLISLLALSATAYADVYSYGIYLGVQGGYVDLHNSRTGSQDPSGILFDKMLLGIDHLGGRAFVGYRANDYLAFEFGYGYLADMAESGGVLNVKDHTRINGMDIAVKGFYPLSRLFSLYAKAGAAYLHQDILNATNGGAIVTYKDRTTSWLPLAGAGLAINFTSSFAMDLSWTRMFKQKHIHNIDFAALGISYTFRSNWT